MRITIAVALGALAVLVTGCNRAEPGPVKRQPGSWSQRVEIVSLSGPKASAAAKAQLQELMNAIAATPVCVTPEFAAQEDVSQQLARVAGVGEACDATEPKVDGNSVSFSTICKETARTVKISGKGVNSATSQTMELTLDGAMGGGTMVMKSVTKREGDCTPGEMTLPVPARKS